MRRALTFSSLAEEAEAVGMSVEEAIEKFKDWSSEANIYERLEHEAITPPSGSSPKEILQRLLSTRSILTTSSSFAERMEKLKRTNARTTSLCNIGTGTFAAIFEIPGTDIAIKKTLFPREKLQHEFRLAREAH